MFIRKPTAIIGKEKREREWMSLKLLHRYIIQYGVAASRRAFVNGAYNGPSRNLHIYILSVEFVTADLVYGRAAVIFR